MLEQLQHFPEVAVGGDESKGVAALVAGSPWAVGGGGTGVTAVDPVMAALDLVVRLGE